MAHGKNGCDSGSVAAAERKTPGTIDPGKLRWMLEHLAAQDPRLFTRVAAKVIAKYA